MAPIRLTESFYHRDCLEVAPDLVGKLLFRRLPDGTVLQERIAETEAYRGQLRYGQQNVGHRILASLLVSTSV